MANPFLIGNEPHAYALAKGRRPGDQLSGADPAVAMSAAGRSCSLIGQGRLHWFGWLLSRRVDVRRSVPVVVLCGGGEDYERAAAIGKTAGELFARQRLRNPTGVHHKLAACRTDS
jgi:hypothetical protein